MATNIWLTTADGDLTTVGNWSLGAVPVPTNDVIFPANSPAIVANLDALKTATIGGSLGHVWFEDGFAGTIGDADGNYMMFTATGLTFAGSGLAYINLEASAISPLILNTAAKANPYSAGLFLLGSALVTVQIKGGDVGVALRAGETATAAAIKLEAANGGSCQAGSGVTLTQWLQTGGDGICGAAATTVTCDAGTLITRGTGAITTLSVYGGEVYPESTGTVTTLNLSGGVTDFRSSRATRVVTTPTISAGATLYMTTDVTFTNKLAFSGACRLDASAAH
jgi:hypothetical protein